MSARVPKPLVARLLVLAGALLGLSLVLSGCVLFRNPAAGGIFLKPAQRHLRFTSGFANARGVAVAHRDPSEYEEYERRTGTARAEAVLSVANGRQTALAFPQYRLQSLTRTWAFNQHSATLRWGKTRYLNDARRSFTYALYQHRSAGQQRGCVAFLRAWDVPPDDPRRRPGKALFGYYCAPIGQRLSLRKAIAVLRGIKTRTKHIPRVYYGQNLPRDPGALAAARGQGKAAVGNPKFPFRFSRYYRISHGTGDVFK